MKSLILLFCFSLFLSVGLANENAEKTFLQAAHLAETDLGQARALYRVAALRFLEEAKSDPLHQGPLLYNAGNAFFLAGESGHAILAYRQAEKSIPTSPLLRDNLRFVRKQSGNPDSEISSLGFFSELIFWLKNPAFHWIAFFILTLLLWIDLFLRQWINRGIPYFPFRFTILFAAFLALLLIYFKFENSRTERGVIIIPQVEARKGPNYGYAPAFTAPLDAGIECEIIGKEEDWFQIKIDRNRIAWVRQSTVEKIPND